MLRVAAAYFAAGDVLMLNKEGEECCVSNEWQYHLIKTVSRIVACLPYPLVLRLGKGAGLLYYHVAGRQRRRAVSQMTERLELSVREAEQTVRRLFLHLGQTLLEVLYMPALTPTQINRYVTFEHLPYLTDALAQGHGVVLLTAHIGNWEWLGAALAMNGFPLTTVIKRQPNDQQTRILNEYRVMAGLEVFARGTTELVGAARALKQGKILGFLADQDAGTHGIFVNFLGKMAATPVGPAVFARRFQSPIVPCFIVHNSQGGHRVLIKPPLYFEDTGNETADIAGITTTMTRLLEDMIREYPDEWLWFQKRWNTPYPPGDNDTYLVKE